MRVAPNYSKRKDQDGDSSFVRWIPKQGRTREIGQEQRRFSVHASGRRLVAVVGLQRNQKGEK